MKKYDILRPSCYGRFSCKGGACRFNCCREWGITMSQEEYKRLSKKNISLDGKVCPVEKTLKSSFASHKMVLDGQGCCPFLSDERLCDLQLSYGVGILSSTCKDYPRIYHRYLDKVEYGLSLGCERVLELLLEEKAGLEFSNVRKGLPESHRFNTYIDDKKRRNHPHLVYYYDIQSLCLSLLQAEGASLEDRLILLGMGLHKVEDLINDGMAGEIPGFIASFLGEIDGSDIVQQLDDVESTHLGVFVYNLGVAKRYKGMADQHYLDLIDNIEKKLLVSVDGDGMHYSQATYRNAQEKFRAFMEVEGRDRFMENIIIAFLFQTNLPFIDERNGLWKNFTYIVWVYSMLKFTLTMALDGDSTEESLIDCCAIMFRKLGHNKALYQWVIDTFEKNNTSTLAHMAIFLKT